eukprot:c18646_g1_i3.p1 GENE.c18646_g1_i3~~c18646_g1_i3.p1  ORF type:complete len:354 (+),score=86.93 c18646_g1_i3:72-1133(+)
MTTTPKDLTDHNEHHETHQINAAQVPSIPSPPLGTWDSPLYTTSVRSPKRVVLNLIRLGIHKSSESYATQFLLSFIAGTNVGIGGLAAVIAAAGITGEGSLGASNPGLPKLMFGAVFPVALFLIIISGAELFTGNCMFLTVALAQKKITLLKLLRSWGMSFIGNFAGCLFVAYFLAYLTRFFRVDPYHKFLVHLTEVKCSLPFEVAFFRAVGCNWLVCLAIFFGMCGDLLIDKVIALWWPIFAFAMIGFEHCVANMFVISLGLMEGADATVGDFIGKNLVPVVLGNIVGGAIFVGLLEWFVYRPHNGEPEFIALGPNDHKPAHPEHRSKLALHLPSWHKHEAEDHPHQELPPH